MKLARLFKKVESFFSLDEQERNKKSKKIEELSLSLSDKMESIKAKLQETQNERKKAKLKKKLEVLKKIEEKLLQEQEQKDG